MICPECKTRNSTVVDSRQRAGVILRVRVCFNNHRFKTEEKVIANVPSKPSL